MCLFVVSHTAVIVVPLCISIVWIELVISLYRMIRSVQFAHWAAHRMSTSASALTGFVLRFIMYTVTCPSLYVLHVSTRHTTYLYSYPVYSFHKPPGKQTQGKGKRTQVLIMHNVFSLRTSINAFDWAQALYPESVVRVFFVFHIHIAFLIGNSSILAVPRRFLLSCNIA